MRIAVVGAGPAGCQLSHRLGDADHEILLFDPRAPYEKPCGGGLSPLVGRLFPDVMALPFRRYHPSCLVLRASDGSQAEHPLATDSWSIVSRAELGQALLDRVLSHGNVQLIREQVVGVDHYGDGWQVRTARGAVHSAAFLVGADGARSIVRKQVVGPIPREHLSLAVGYRVRGGPESMMIQTFSDMEGYLWSFPRPDHASVGIGSRLGTVAANALWQRLDRFLDEMDPGDRRAERWAALVPTACDSTMWDAPCVGKSWALLGDAAGHVHPLTGEGITYALWSAELLADALEQGEPLAYERLWREQYGRALVATVGMRRHIGQSKGGYEALFHLMAVITFSTLGDVDRGTSGGSFRL